jgi:hypothetical protein
VMNGLKNEVYIQNRVLFTNKEEWNEIIFSVKWTELENIMLSEASHAQNVKGHMSYFICGSQIYKLNVCANTYMIVYMSIYVYIYSERPT